MLARLGRTGEAYDAFAKATWNGEWRQAASVELARLDLRAGRHAAAEKHAAEALRRDADDARARSLLVVARRCLGRDADALVAEALALDPLDQLALHLAGRPTSDDPATKVDLAMELAAAGQFDSAIALAIAVGGSTRTPAGNEAPIALYLAAAWFETVDRAADAAAARSTARAVDATLAFPSLLEHHDALVSALAADDSDSRAHALLGSLLYHHGRHAEALAHWLRAVELDPTDPVALRNAAIASYNHNDDPDAAVAFYDRALAVAPGDARLWYESDQLWKRLDRPAAQRLERIPEAALHRDDLAVEYAELLTALDRPHDALALLLSRPFAPWEGGEGRALAAWDHANEALGNGVVDPPASLGEARPAFTAPAPVRTDGTTDYFATSLPDLLLFR